MLGAGIDPSAQRKIERRGKGGRRSGRQTRYKAVARGVHRQRKSVKVSRPVTLAKARWLLKLMAPEIGARPVSEITAQKLRCRQLPKVEGQGNLETARRMRSFAGRVFRYGIATGRAERDPSSDIRGALPAPRT